MDNGIDFGGRQVFGLGQGLTGFKCVDIGPDRPATFLTERFNTPFHESMVQERAP